MTEARYNYEDIKDLINDCDYLFDDVFSKHQIMQLVAHPKEIFETIVYNCNDLFVIGYHRDVIISRISLLTVDSIHAVTRYSDLLVANGMSLETILETAAEEDGHLHLEEKYMQLFSPSY